MDRQFELAKSSDPKDRSKSLFYAINNAFKPDASSQLQQNVLKGMTIFVSRINKDINSMRKEMLDPLNRQKKETLASIDRAYYQLHYANSIITGHLSSVVKVHETQAELLREIGVERDLRRDIANNLDMTSREIGELVNKAEAADNKLVEADEYANKIKGVLGEFEERLNKIREEK
jgi:hypothetical protein